MTRRGGGTVVFYSPGIGRGKATRAAAIARHLDDVVVLRDHARWNEPLDRRGIATVVVPRLTERVGALALLLKDLRASGVVWDGPGTAPAGWPTVRIHRYGRSRQPGPTVSIERTCPPGCFDGWGLLSLDVAEIAERDLARRELGVTDRGHLTVVVPSSPRPGQVERAVPEAARTIRLDRRPALRWLRAADHVVGAPGANLWTEVQFLGLSATWTATMPDQQIRLDQEVGTERAPIDRSRPVAEWIAQQLNRG